MFDFGEGEGEVEGEDEDIKFTYAGGKFAVFKFASRPSKGSHGSGGYGGWSASPGRFGAVSQTDEPKMSREEVRVEKARFTRYLRHIRKTLLLCNSLRSSLRSSYPSPTHSFAGGGGGGPGLVGRPGWA